MQLSRYILWLLLITSYFTPHNLLGLAGNPGFNENDSLFYPIYDYEYIPDATYDEIQDRISSIQTTVPLNFNTRVKAFVDYFTIKDREYTKTVMGRLNLYFPLFEEYLKKYNLPDELKYLAIVESGLVPRAKSPASAVGMWQFMSGTGRYYGLYIDWYIDDRMDPEKSTEAACKYLTFLYNYFNDWELAMAAYNCGPGRVRQAIRKSGYKKDFWQIYRYLPRETRSYVPQFVAMMYTIHFAEEHNFTMDEYVEYIPETDTLVINQFLYLKTFADLTNVCVEDLEKLNPKIKRRAIPTAAKDFVFYIPSDIKPLVEENREFILDSARRTGKEELEYLARYEVGSTWGRERIIHIVRSGDAISLLAEKYKVRSADIRAWNNLSGNLIRIGQRLKIWVNDEYYNSINSNTLIAKQEPVPIISGKIHLVQPGESLWEISRMYDGLTIEKIKKLNNLTSNKIMPGQKLRIS